MAASIVDASRPNSTPVCAPSFDVDSALDRLIERSDEELSVKGSAFLIAALFQTNPAMAVRELERLLAQAEWRGCRQASAASEERHSLRSRRKPMAKQPRGLCS